MNEERTISRREFMKGVGGICAAATLGASWPAFGSSRSGADRPNILFAMADDWSWPHASACGDKVVKTPAFDRVAREGVLFNHSFCTAPSCAPSRGSILSGQEMHRLGEGANIWSTLSKDIPVYPDILEEAGYYVGYTRKGWSPGQIAPGGRTRNPAGFHFRTFDEFMEGKPSDQPFCFWFGSIQPHRPFEEGAGLRAGMKLEDVEVPPFLPDTPEVRSDILDYYYQVMRFDTQVSELMDILDEGGLSENTLLVVTSDNGMAFPRGKCNLYDAGTRMPTAIRWPARVKGGRTVDCLSSHTDFAPTFLEAAGLKPLPEMNGQSLMPILIDGKPASREYVGMGREKHTHYYPVRAIRTHEFLYIRNIRPERWPAAIPPPGQLGDIDASPTKDMLVERREDPEIAKYYDLAVAKRPEEELFDVIRKDPWQLKNLADSPEYAETKRKMRAMLDTWMSETGDIRSYADTDWWNTLPERR